MARQGYGTVCDVFRRRALYLPFSLYGQYQSGRERSEMPFIKGTVYYTNVLSLQFVSVTNVSAVRGIHIYECVHMVITESAVRKTKKEVTLNLEHGHYTQRSVAVS
ncbi:hypothetical protein J6590_056598 [Homalodisca vitripennis]|nr:hypothetical protein J6590_089887 [Homalodisca vitripennis]KAG8320966.1 hypothetical protein J6590_056598 [Homalodisca vitripennis]